MNRQALAFLSLVEPARPVSREAMCTRDAKGEGSGAFVGVNPPSGGHVLQRASVGDGLKPYVSAQRGSNKQ